MTTQRKPKAPKPESPPPCAVELFGSRLSAVDLSLPGVRAPATWLQHLEAVLAC